MRLSILVVSKTPTLLNQMLRSVSNSTALSKVDIEILCSWNGTADNEKDIINTSGCNFLITQRVPYHFSSNLNALADKAKGELLLLINDDIILDKGSIDEAVKCLEFEPKAGLVGGRLRNKQGGIQHAGILFDAAHRPYHFLESLLHADSNILTEKNRIMPAITGALMLVKKQVFQTLYFNTSYETCGEDIEFCLDLREKLELQNIYCPTMTGIHFSSTTRKEKGQEGDNPNDMEKMQKRRLNFLGKATKQQLGEELAIVQLEAEVLRERALPNASNLPEIERWESQCHALQLQRLRQKEEIQALKDQLSLSKINFV